MRRYNSPRRSQFRSRVPVSACSSTSNRSVCTTCHAAGRTGRTCAGCSFSAVPDSARPVSSVPGFLSSRIEAVAPNPLSNPVPNPVPSEPIPAPAAPLPALATPIPAPAAQLPAPVQPVSAAPAPPPISAPPLTSASPIRPPERAAPQAERRVPIAEPRFGYEEPDDYLRPPTLFASAEVEPRRFRLFPTLIGVLVVFAFIAFLLERSNPAIFSSLVGTQKATTPRKQSRNRNRPHPHRPQPSRKPKPRPHKRRRRVIARSSQRNSKCACASEVNGSTAELEQSQHQPSQHRLSQHQLRQDRHRQSRQQTESSSVPMTGQSVPPPVTRPARALDHENSRGAVARQVLPSVSPNARRSMRRPMEISVLVSGRSKTALVTSATYGSYGPGNYFARIKLSGRRMTGHLRRPCSTGALNRASGLCISSSIGQELRLRHSRTHADQRGEPCPASIRFSTNPAPFRTTLQPVSCATGLKNDVGMHHLRGGVGLVEEVGAGRRPPRLPGLRECQQIGTGAPPPCRRAYSAAVMAISAQLRRLRNLPRGRPLFFGRALANSPQIRRSDTRSTPPGGWPALHRLDRCW